MHRITFDLAATAPVGYATAYAPAGQRIEVEVVNRAPGMPYHVALGGSVYRIVAPTETATFQDRAPLQPGKPVVLAVAEVDPETGAANEVVRRLVVSVTPPGPAWRWEDETAWLVEDTATETLLMLFAAVHGRAAAGADLTLTLERRGNPGTAAFDVQVRHPAGLLEVGLNDDAVWRPASYLPLAEAALAAWEPAAPSPSLTAAPRLLQALTRPTVDVFVAATADASERLAQAPASPVAHEEAALVLSSLALREMAEVFHDTRPILGRITAHLAVARALRGDSRPSLAGELADATLLALAGRQAEALELLDSIGAARLGAPGRAWASALRIRITRDWRLLKRPRSATLLEQLEQYDALGSTLSSHHALEFLDQIDPEDVPDWGRMAVSHAPVVATGNRLVAGQVRAELVDAARALLHDGAPVTSSALRDALDAPPEHCFRPGAGDALAAAVIDRGLWGAFYQRHLLAAAAREEFHARFMLGAPIEADQLRRRFADAFGGLKLAPLLGARLVPDAGEEHPWRDWDAASTCSAGAALSRDEPERLNVGPWDQFEKACPEALASGELRSQQLWFGRQQIPGTAYVPHLRLRAPLVHLMGLQEYVEMRELAPWNPSVATAYYRARIGARRPLPFREVFGPLLDFSLAVRRFEAELNEDDAAAHLASYQTLCDLEADHCSSLGDMLVREARDAEAEAAYERAFEKARDRVRVSNRMRWLVMRHLEQGRVSRATAIARAAAATGSGGGIETLAMLQERLGHDAEASELFRQVAERYEPGGASLDEFFAAYAGRVGDGRFGDEAVASVARVFPGGIESASIADFEGPPTSGVRILEDTVRLRQIGLDPGAVIVALDGYRVRNVQQYRCVRRFRFDREIELIVYHKAAYRVVRATLPQRTFDARLDDHP